LTVAATAARDAARVLVGAAVLRQPSRMWQMHLHHGRFLLHCARRWFREPPVGAGIRAWV